MLSENWELVSTGTFNLYKSKDNTYICLMYTVRPEYEMILMRSCFIRDLNLVIGPLQNYKWCPLFGDETREGYKIYLQFDGEFCNNILDRGESLDQYCPDWKEQLEQLCVDLQKEKVYKVTMDPRYFFINKDKVLKTFGFFNSYHYGEQPVNMQLFMSLYSNNELKLIQSRIYNYNLDFKFLEEYVYNNATWPDNILADIYKKLHADTPTTN